ncbi:MAG: methylated-DNA--[protein]-cysteine S-methyltransferase [Chloroflexota bacterium]
MDAHGYAVFETPIGQCGVIWGEHGITGTLLPASDARQMQARIRRRAPAAQPLPPPPDVQHAIHEMARLLHGEPRDLTSIGLDLAAVDPFNVRVYEAARAIPPGRTLTYGQLAAQIGEPGAARAVGQALGQNPFPIVVPCHRVVAAGGKMGGFSAPGGVTTKLRMLAIEGAAMTTPLPLFESV